MFIGTSDVPITDPHTTNEEKPKRKKRKKGVLSEISKERLEMMEEMKKHHTNLIEILSWSNATPFVGITYRGFLCCYCDTEFSDAADLKKHTIKNHEGLYASVIPHPNKNIKDEFSMRLDITDLQCILCDRNMDTLENLINHLANDHFRGIHTDIKNQLIPFKFDGEIMKCCVCSSVFEKFRGLLEHMHIHYRNFICDECDMGFVTKGSLRSHIAGHATGVFKCNICSKTFESKRNASRHEKVVHVFKGYRFRCGYCNYRFKSPGKREVHLEEIHGIKMKVLQCQACDRTFPSANSLKIHRRRDHMIERRFKCTLCDKAFFKGSDLKFHMVTHTKTRDFQCTVCLKSYGRKETLRQHMQIHSDIRRFKCEHCGLTFVQKCTWKAHLKCKHGME